MTEFFAFIEEALTLPHLLILLMWLHFGHEIRSLRKDIGEDFNRINMKLGV